MAYNVGATPTPNGNACNFVYLKKDQIYHHNLVQFHFTTYDIQRSTDIINPGPSHCNVMLLADNTDAIDNSSNPQHFLYTHILGVYHGNVIYTRPRMHDYEACCLDFLWVRWYELVDPESSGWHSSRLDSVCFPPMSGDGAFGFIDPRDVLHGCHIIPNYHGHFKPDVILVVTSATAQGKQIKAVPLTMVHAPTYHRLQVAG